MQQGTANQKKAKAEMFFQRAQKVAKSENFDYAIELYLEGLRCDPEALTEGHLPLHDLALVRQARGGKKPGMVERLKKMRAKTPLEKMLNAEYLFSKDPDNVSHAINMMTAAAEGQYKKTARWIADLVFQANNAADKSSVSTYKQLKDSYKSIGEYDRALAACQRAAQLKPTDSALQDEYKLLSAELTVQKGKYDEEGDFRKSINDAEAQALLRAKEEGTKSQKYRMTAIESARKAYEEDPDLPKNIINLAKELSDTDTEEQENEAIELLETKYREKSVFNYKEQAGQTRIKQLKRKLRTAKQRLKKNPKDAQTRQKAIQLSKRLKQTELEHYKLCVENYPTETSYKYEYGVRLIQNKRYDDAIPLLQEASREPRRKVAAMNKIGLCFLMKKWYPDAIDIFQQAIEAHQIDDDALGKELRYNLARAHEDHGQTDQAVDIYRKIAQMDFAYKDVRKRLDQLRKSK